MVSLTAVAPRLRPALVPVAVLLAALAWLVWADHIDIPVELVRLGPAGALALAFVMAIYLKLSNVASIVLLIGGSLFLVEAEPTSLPPALASETVRMTLVSVLLPLNLVLFSLLPDRGLATVPGLFRASFVIMQGGIALATLVVWPGLTESGPLPGVSERVGALDYGSPIAAATALMAVSPVPPVGWLAFGLAGVVLFFLSFRRSSPLEVGILVAAVAVLGSLHLSTAPPQHQAVMALAAGGGLVAALLQNGYRLAFVDELTDLPGRRALELEMRRLGGRYVVAMIDIDHFKSFNDTYGHDVGDDALRMVASHIRKVGGGGKPFRYGGEEFTVLFAGMSLDDAMEWLEDLRADIECTPFNVRERSKRPDGKKASRRRRGGSRRSRSLTLTISAGAAERSDRLRTPDQVIKAADKALYRAKENGRNRVSK